LIAAGGTKVSPAVQSRPTYFRTFSFFLLLFWRFGKKFVSLQPRLTDIVMDYNNWDYYSTMKTATEKSRAEGRAEGVLDVARNLKRMNIPIADISKATSLSVDDIEKL
jgi:hypothetical protein